MPELNILETSNEVSLKRPWQGTTLGVFSVIGAVGSFLFAIMLLTLQGMITSLFSSGISMDGHEVNVEFSGGFGAMFAMFVIPFTILFILIGILDIFVARGFFKGQRWEMILIMIGLVLGTLGTAGQIFSGFEEGFGNFIFSIGFLIFNFYLVTICWKPTFSGQ